MRDIERVKRAAMAVESATKWLIQCMQEEYGDSPEITPGTPEPRQIVQDGPGCDSEAWKVQSTVQPRQGSQRASQAAPRKSGEYWRLTSIRDIGLTEKMIACLDSVGIRTVGQLCDWTAEPHHRITQIPGVGPAMASWIEQIVERFFREGSRRQSS